MPELPEVETTRNGLMPYVVGQRIRDINVREARLRWEVPSDLPLIMRGKTVKELSRRGKYLIFRTEAEAMLVHLGMSGSMRVVSDNKEPLKHDHIDVQMENGQVLRYRDPRRFGAFLIMRDDTHPLLDHLGPEPLSDEFSAEYLFRISRKRKQSIKSLIMDSKKVTGVGNIYAVESLFLAGIRPGVAAGRVSGSKIEALVAIIKQVLTAAIAQGGTTLKDFVNEDGQPGYFQQSLNVYGRGGQSCYSCNNLLKEVRQSGRSSVYCPVCQR